MDNLLDIYTKLKLYVGNEIIITYYTSDGQKHTEEAILSDIIDFSHIFVRIPNKTKTQEINIQTNQHIKKITFFSEDNINESISFKSSKTTIYKNPYLINYNNPFNHYEELIPKMTDLFNIEQSSFQKRKEQIKKYFNLDTKSKYEDLFFSQTQKEEFETFFSLLVQELKIYALKNGYNQDLKEISTGSTSIVYELGDKIIKIGKPRRHKTIPYCEFILQPIINRTLEFDDYPIHLEITQKVLVLNNQDEHAHLSEDERFQEAVSVLSQSLYSIGLSSNDLHPGNVGILLKDNKIHYDEITFDTGDSNVTSISNNNNLRILSKGRSVIIDLDDIIIENKEKYYQYLDSIGLTTNKEKILKP